MAVASAKAAPINRVLRIFPWASGCWAIAFTALLVAKPIPNHPPITASAAIPTPIAVKLIFISS